MSEQLFQGEYVSSDRILYTPSEFAKNNLIYLQEIGRLKAQKQHTSKRQNLASFLFFYVKSGSGVLDYGSKEYNLTQGDCVFINCLEPYSHRTSKELWELEWIHFNGENVLPIYQKYLERGGQPVFKPNGLKEPTSIWERLNRVAGSTDYIRDIRINQELSALLTFLMSFSWNPEAEALSKSSTTAFSLKEYLDSHYKEKISLDNLADQFLINKYTLSRNFKDQFGTSIINYLLMTRITHAKQLLRFTEMTVEEVGNECGISHLYYFSRIFKQIEGISPMDYRSQWR